MTEPAVTTLITDELPALETLTHSCLVRENQDTLHHDKENFIKADSRKEYEELSNTMQKNLYLVKEFTINVKMDTSWRAPAKVHGKENNGFPMKDTMTA